MAKRNTKKICIVVLSLSDGGAEKSSAILSILLDRMGYDVHIISVLDKIEYEYNGQLLNLGKLKTTDNSFFGRLKRYRVFKDYLKQHNFDFIIDNRTRIGFLKEFILSRFTYNPAKTIYCVRSSKLHNYINPNRFFSRFLYGTSYGIVAVSNEIANELKKRFGFNNISVINNPIDEVIQLQSEQFYKSNGSYILFYGRLVDKIKNITLLLESYASSRLPDNNVRLKILGSGEDESLLKRKSEEFRVNNFVDFLDFQQNPYPIVKGALFTVLTSRYEGFPRVLIESLAIGTPVLSVDCNSGPSEIIIHEKNGLLVDNYNALELSNGMNRLVEDQDLYLHCKSNARASVEKFNMENIGGQWQKLLS